MSVRARGARPQQNQFDVVENARLARSKMNLSYTHTTTIDSGWLYPLYFEEVLPGDVLTFNADFLARLTTPIVPFMTPLHLDWHVFHAPTRLLYDDFPKFMGVRENPDDHNDYTPPFIEAPAGGWLHGSLHDYLGLPLLAPGVRASSLYHRLYGLCYKEWYRDANLQNANQTPTNGGDGDIPDDETPYVLRRRNKRKDYFAGALPWAQRGDPVSIPLGENIPLGGVGVVDHYSVAPTFIPSAGNPVAGNMTLESTVTNVGFDGTGTVGATMMWDNPRLQMDPNAGNNPLYVDSLAVTVNDLRTAVALQHLLERDARGGSRWPELVYAHFNEHTDDIRLMRPEILGVGSVAINPTPIPQTTPSGIVPDVTPQGNLAAFAAANGGGGGFTKKFHEHGLVMLIASIRSELVYQQGLDRRFSRTVREHYFWPDLQHLGEQVVESREIFSDGTGDPDLLTGDYEVWGYQPRYEEYRHRRSMVTGTMRSNHPTPLDVWHLALDFDTRPALNDAFIREQPPVDRVVAVTNEPEWRVDCAFHAHLTRPMAKYGTPGLDRL